MSAVFTRRPDPVAAIKWTGLNFPEVEAFFAQHVGDVEQTWLRNEPDEDWTPENTPRFSYNMVQFYDGSDDRSADPDGWIIVHLTMEPGDPERIEVLDEARFFRFYEAQDGAA